MKSRIDLYSKEDVNYGIPTHVGASVAFYNTEILEEAGVNYQDIVTWEDFKQAGIQVYEKPANIWGRPIQARLGKLPCYWRSKARI